EACWMEPFAFQAEDGIRSFHVTGVQACALPIYARMPDVSACGQWVGIRKRSSSGAPPAWTGADRMYVLSVISTKGGVGKTTITRSEERRVGSGSRPRRQRWPPENRRTQQGLSPR